MQRQFGETAILVGKSGFNDQVFQVVDTVDDLPQRIIRTGITAEHQAAFPAVQPVTDRGYRMVGR